MTVDRLMRERVLEAVHCQSLTLLSYLPEPASVLMHLPKESISREAFSKSI
jgi:hypothetical protein